MLAKKKKWWHFPNSLLLRPTGAIDGQCWIWHFIRYSAQIYQSLFQVKHFRLKKDKRKEMEQWVSFLTKKSGTQIYREARTCIWQNICNMTKHSTGSSDVGKKKNGGISPILLLRPTGAIDGQCWIWHLFIRYSAQIYSKFIPSSCKCACEPELLVIRYSAQIYPQFILCDSKFIPEKITFFQQYICCDLIQFSLIKAKRRG